MLESCSYSALGETTLLTSPFSAQLCVSPFHLQSISYYGNNMSLPGGGVQPQPKQPRINSSPQIHILGQSPCSSAREWEQSPGCAKGADLSQGMLAAGCVGCRKHWWGPHSPGQSGHGITGEGQDDLLFQSLTKGMRVETNSRSAGPWLCHVCCILQHPLPSL